MADGRITFMTDWMRNSRWQQVRLGPEAFADYLDTTAESIHDALARSVSFPRPADERYGPRWTEYQVFTTILDHYPGLADRVPRMFPAAASLAPAQFLGAERVQLGAVSDGVRDQFVVHYWQPADDRGVVAVAYPGSYVQSSNPEDLAEELLKSLAVSAVAVPCGMRGPIPHREFGDSQPVVGVADHCATVLSKGRWHWFDLAPLLRVDLPWWPLGLTDLDAILAWRPGDPPRRLKATHWESGGAAWLTRAAETADPATKSVLATIASWVDYQICADCGLTPDGLDDLIERPGLRRAAVADLPAHHSEFAPEDAARALHHIVDDPTTAYWAARIGSIYDAWLPLMAGWNILTLNRDELSRPGHEWCNRLVPVPPERHNELGFAALSGVMTAKDASPHQWWSDPLNPDMWAISDEDGTVFATIGTRVPAVGQLTEVQVGHSLASSANAQPVFFRDSTGAAWPMPAPTSWCYYYWTGVEDDHSERLATSINTLCEDAAADTSHGHHRRNDVVDRPLLRHIVATPAPFTLTRADIERMR